MPPVGFPRTDLRGQRTSEPEGQPYHGISPRMSLSPLLRREWGAGGLPHDKEMPW